MEKIAIEYRLGGFVFRAYEDHEDWRKNGASRNPDPLLTSGISCVDIEGREVFAPKEFVPLFDLALAILQQAGTVRRSYHDSEQP